MTRQGEASNDKNNTQGRTARANNRIVETTHEPSRKFLPKSSFSAQLLLT